MKCECGCGQDIPDTELFRYRPPYLLRGHRFDTPLCACGCGERLNWSPNLRYQKRAGFRKGHHLRKAPPQQPQPCACGCGELTTVIRGKARRFISGHNRPQFAGHSEETKSRLRDAATTHGMSHTLTYKSWLSMIGRCYEPRNASFERYGARGITVCDRWLISKGGSFENFFADLGERKPGYTLDRVDPNGNYEPSNCRWATYVEQRANQRPRHS